MSAQALVLRHGATEQKVFFAVAASPGPGDFLNQEESARFAEFKFAAKKEGFLLGRLAAKRALAALLSEPDLRQIEIRSGESGQPLVRHPRAASVDVTVSHSHGLAVALAFPSSHPTGIDLESVSAQAAATILGEMGLSEIEKEWIATAALAQETACGVLWTAREALGKALRTGLTSPFGAYALRSIQPSGDGGWIGGYLNYPDSKCLCRAFGARVLSLAIPNAAELWPWPALP